MSASRKVRGSRSMAAISSCRATRTDSSCICALTLGVLLPDAAPAYAQTPVQSTDTLLTGKAAFGDWHADAPLVRRKITVSDLPAPYATKSADNAPREAARPPSFVPLVPPGFRIDLFAGDLHDPRALRTAPNGDIFVAESEPGRIRVLRSDNGAIKPSTNEVFASGLQQPFGMSYGSSPAVQDTLPHG